LQRFERPPFLSLPATSLVSVGAGLWFRIGSGTACCANLLSADGGILDVTWHRHLSRIAKRYRERLTCRYPIGIDIGQRHVYAAQIEDERNGLMVKGLFQRAIGEAPDASPDWDKEITASLTQIRKSRQFRGKGAVVSLPSSDMLNFPIRIAIDPERDVEEAIVEEAKNHLPYPVSEAILDYPSLVQVASGKSELYRATVVSVHRDTLERYERIFQHAGLVLEAVDFNALALFRLYRRRYPESAGVFALALIGRNRTMLSVISGEEILGHRNIHWGVQTLADKLMVNFGHLKGLENTRLLLERYGLSHHRFNGEDELDGSSAGADQIDTMRAVSQVITPLVEELVHEFHKMFSYIRSETASVFIDTLYLYGDAAGVCRLDSFLSDRLGIPTALIDPLSDGTFKMNGASGQAVNGSVYALALGLAARRIPWL
jgi:type IV pilus assembly protein PilM